MVALKLLPFDAHNHIQLGPPPIPPPLASGRTAESIEDGFRNRNGGLSTMSSLGEYILEELKGKHLSGMAIMATHPRDFSTILGLEQEIQEIQHQQQQEAEAETLNKDGIGIPPINISSDAEERLKIVPCLGVHPWFLHELDPTDDWAMVSSSSSSSLSLDNDQQLVPKWTADLEELLKQHPEAPVGEIGLDGFHFRLVESNGDGNYNGNGNCNGDGESRQELTTPMETQIRAFVLQLEIATRLKRPVSLHCVRAMGSIMDAMERVASEHYERLAATVDDGVLDPATIDESELLVLPPRIYFHAFGGKASTVTQLIKTLEKPRRIKLRNNNNNNNSKSTKKFLKITPPKLYFGFAPPVNFQSPKTPSVVKAVGLDRLVLETDREDVRSIAPDCRLAVHWLASILGVTKDELIRATNANARDLYSHSWSGDAEDRDDPPSSSLSSSSPPPE